MVSAGGDEPGQDARGGAVVGGLVALVDFGGQLFDLFQGAHRAVTETEARVGVESVADVVQAVEVGSSVGASSMRRPARVSTSVLRARAISTRTESRSTERMPRSTWESQDSERPTRPASSFWLRPRRLR